MKLRTIVRMLFILAVVFLLVHPPQAQAHFATRTVTAYSDCSPGCGPGCCPSDLGLPCDSCNDCWNTCVDALGPGDVTKCAECCNELLIIGEP